MANLELETWRLQFNGSLNAFKDDDKASPKEVMAKVNELEIAVAILQTAQSTFNLATMVKVGENTMTLEQAIKMVGGAGRASSMWRQASGAKRRHDYYGDRDLSRKSDEEYAQPTISNTDALTLAKEAEKLASQLRGAIAIGNTRKVDIAGLDPLWFT